MNEIVKTFGYNAGKVWDVLEKDGPQVQSKLMKKADLREDEFYSAIGWLARENKICRDKRTYKIGETNLTTAIGNNAGKVWSVINRDDELDVTAISRMAKIGKQDCYTALGWLAREGKITTKLTVKKRH